MNRFHTIALDIDGTLLNSHHVITPKTSHLIQKISQQLQVLLVTGRHHQMALPIYQQLNLSTPMICGNGAYVFDPNSHEIFGTPLQEANWRFVLNVASNLNFDSMCHFSSGIGHNPENIHVRKISGYIDSFFTLSNRPRFFSADDLQRLCASQPQVWKIELHGKDDVSVSYFIESVQQNEQITIDQTGPLSLEIVNKGCSKGNRLTEYLQSSGLSSDQVVAFGDNFNDLSMFKQVGLGIAMGNAHPDVQDAAHHVTASNDEDGIAIGLLKFWDQLELTGSSKE